MKVSKQLTLEDENYLENSTLTIQNGAILITERIGQDNFDENKHALKHQIIQLIKQRISSEFVNRIDEIVLFNPLSKDVIRKIVLLQLTRLKEKLIKSNIDVSIDNSVINYIIDVGYDPEMGARPIKRAIDKYILDPLVQSLLSEDLNKDSHIRISYIDGVLKFSN